MTKKSLDKAGEAEYNIKAHLERVPERTGRKARGERAAKRRAPCKLNNEKHVKHLGQLRTVERLKRVVLKRELKNSQRKFLSIARSEYLMK